MPHHAQCRRCRELHTGHLLLAYHSVTAADLIQLYNTIVTHTHTEGDYYELVRMAGWLVDGRGGDKQLPIYLY